MSEKLLPCPFCGKVPELYQETPSAYFQPICCDKSAKTKAEAIRIWNTRAPSPALDRLREEITASQANEAAMRGALGECAEAIDAATYEKSWGQIADRFGNAAKAELLKALSRAQSALAPNPGASILAELDGLRMMLLAREEEHKQSVHQLTTSATNIIAQRDTAVTLASPALDRLREEIVPLIQRILELDAKATVGPWIIGSIPWKVWANGGRNTVCDVGACGDAVPVQECPGLSTSESMAANRDLIAEYRTLAPKLARALRIIEELYEN